MRRFPDPNRRCSHDVPVAVLDSGSGGAPARRLRRGSGKRAERGGVSDDLEEQQLLYFSATELQEALDLNRVKIITWQAGFTMAMQHLLKQ